MVYSIDCSIIVYHYLIVTVYVILFTGEWMVPVTQENSANQQSSTVVTVSSPSVSTSETTSTAQSDSTSSTTTSTTASTTAVTVRAPVGGGGEATIADMDIDQNAANASRFVTEALCPGVFEHVL